jgi:hypothetical protein
MDPTLASLQTQVNAILSRLALLDGTGLTAPAVGFTSTTASKLTGLQIDIQQAILSLEANLNELYTNVSSLSAQVDQLLGVTNIPYTPVIIVPPTT